MSVADACCMDGVTSTRRKRAAKVLVGLLLLVAATAASGLVGLLLLMAALVPLGAAVADVALWPGMRDTVRHWHHQFEPSKPADSRPKRP
jgi:hypothetical protein